MLPPRLRGDDSVAPPTSPRGKKRAPRVRTAELVGKSLLRTMFTQGSAARRIPRHASDALQSEMHSST